MKLSYITPLVVAASLCHAQTPLSAQDALKLAAQNRPALQSAKLGIEHARAASQAFGAYAATRLYVGASSRSELGATDQDLQLSQPIDIFGRRQAGQRFGEAGIQLSLAEYVVLATDLQNDVLTAYAEAVANQHQKEVAADLLIIAEGLFTATKRRFDEGNVAETQVTRASIEFERAKQSAELATADLEASLERLAGLIGTKPQELAIQADARIEPLVNPVIDGRPDLLVLRSQVMIADAEAGIAKVSNRPELDFQLVRSPWGEERGSVAGRLQLSWSLFDHGKARNETRAARKRGESAQKLLQDATGRANTEVRAAQIALEARQSRIARYEAILASARDLVAKSQKGYSEGFGTQIEVLEATRALREVEKELVEARHQLALAVIAQYRASGYLAEVLK